MQCRPQPLPASTAVNLMPVIDVTFLLVIFFMLVHHLVADPSLPVELPRVSSLPAGWLSPDGKVWVHARPDGLHVGEQVMSWDQARRLADHLGEAGPVEVVLRADASLTWQQVQPLLAAMQTAGVGRLHIAVQPMEPD